MSEHTITTAEDIYERAERAFPGCAVELSEDDEFWIYTGRYVREIVTSPDGDEREVVVCEWGDA